MPQLKCQNAHSCVVPTPQSYSLYAMEQRCSRLDVLREILRQVMRQKEKFKDKHKENVLLGVEE